MINPAIVSAIAALAGSLIGASAPVLTTWIVQRSQYVTQQRLGDRSRREALYSEFIIEASARFAEALIVETVEIGHVVTLHALLSRIRLYADDDTIAAAEAVLHNLIQAYFAPPFDNDRLRDVAGVAANDPLLGFSHQARIELLRLR